MKKRHSIHLLLAAAALLLATAACTKDELADGDRLPEGQYPLEIARITLGVEGGEAQPWGTPATRVSENGDGTGSKFDAGDPFAVQIDDGTETATYTVQDDSTATSDAPLYWSDRDDHTVNAWYPATPLDLSDQTNGLAYLLHGTGRGNFQNPVKLIFTHSLAKVRVTPSNDIAKGEVTSLQLYTYTTCTHTQGKINTEDAQEGWIEMKKCEYTENGNAFTCWEANVVPGYTITKLMANNDNKERDLSAAITPEAGKFYNITLDKDKGYTDDGQGNYTVTSAEGLKNIAKLVNEEWKLGINITLTADIDLKGIDWTPIGKDDNKAYTGTFDGNGKTITGLTVTGSYKYAGLFGDIDENGTVKNVVLEGVQITSDNSSGSVGGVAGDSWGTIENCSVSGSVSGTTFAGGVVGSQRGGSITGCNSSATVKGVIFAGGIAGETNSGASLTGCYATGDVTVENDGTNNSHAGGVVGYNGGGTLTACYAWGSVTGSGSGTIYVGGVTGTNDEGTLTACYHANGTVSGPAGTTGGVTGRNYKAIYDPVITACYWGDNGQTQGIGYNQAGTGETTQVTDDDWQTAANAMNAALTAESWRYTFDPDNSLPVLWEP